MVALAVGIAAGNFELALSRWIKECVNKLDKSFMIRMATRYGIPIVIAGLCACGGIIMGQTAQ